MDAQVQKGMLSSVSAWNLAGHAKLLASARILHAMSRSRQYSSNTKWRNLSPAIRAWANLTKVFGCIQAHIRTLSIQAHAQLCAKVIDAWHLVRLQGVRRWAVIFKSRVHHGLNLLGDAYESWCLKVHRRLKINRIQSNAMLKHFLLRGTVLNLWRKVVQKSALRQRKLVRMSSRLSIRCIFLLIEYQRTQCTAFLC